MNPIAGASLKSLSNRLRAVVRETTFGPEMLDGLARVGYGARGVVYLFLGLLAMASALSETRPPSMGGAFSIIEDLPAGWFFLLGIAFGLCAYAGWRLVEAALDLKNRGRDARGLVRRTGLLMEAVLYAGFGLLAIAVALDRSTLIRQAIEEEAAIAGAWTARILDWPLGHWLVAVAGLGAVAMGLNQFTKARGSAFEGIRATGGAMIMIRVLGRIGLAARGVILGATGILFLMAAWQAEAAAAGGLRAALQALASVPLGDWVLLAVSAGMVLYGLFNLVKGWRHKAAKMLDGQAG